MTVLQQLDLVSTTLAEKLAAEAAHKEQDGDAASPTKDVGEQLSDWTNGVGWGDFTRASAPR